MPMRWNSQNKFFSTLLRVAFPASKIADFLVSRAKQARKVYTRNRKVFFLIRGTKTRVNIFRLLFRVWRCLSCSRKLVRGWKNTEKRWNNNCEASTLIHGANWSHWVMITFELAHGGRLVFTSKDSSQANDISALYVTQWSEDIQLHVDHGNVTLSRLFTHM